MTSEISIKNERVIRNINMLIQKPESCMFCGSKEGRLLFDWIADFKTGTSIQRCYHLECREKNKGRPHNN